MVEDVVAGRVVGGVGPREAEVDDADAPVLADVEIPRLHVAMHEPRAVRRRQPLAGGDHHAEHLLLRRLLGEQPRLERRALDELRREEDVALERPDVVHRDDVRMRQPRQRLRLAEQPRAPSLRLLSRARPRVQELQRDGPLELRIVRLVDDAHPALARAIDDDVPPDDGPAVQGRPPIAEGRRRDGVPGSATSVSVGEGTASGE